MKSDLSPDELARLVDFTSQESTPAEAEATRQWLADHPEQQRIVETLSRIRWTFSGESQQLLPVNPQLAVQAVLEQAETRSTGPADDPRDEIPASRNTNVRVPLSHASITSPSKPISILRRAMWPVMAGVLSAVGVIVGWQHLTAPDVAPSNGRVFRYATANGKQATVTLPDGSTVLLNVASRLEVPADYDRGNRTVTLTGEAFFTVQHADHSPFIVVAGPSSTRVLGTSFTARYYPSDSAAVVAVRDGKVSVQAAVLTASQQVTVLPNGRTTPVQRAASASFSFASGLLRLDNVPLAAAIPSLNRWFDADIRIADPALTKNILVAGSFQAGSVAELAALLEQTFDVRIVRDGRVLTIYP